MSDGNSDPLENEKVTLVDEQGNELWTTLTDVDGNAYLFYAEDVSPAAVKVNGESQEFSEEMSFVTEASAAPVTGLQCMFILDTTGSMGDELNYLKRDFASIVEDVGSSNVLYSANFCGDEFILLFFRGQEDTVVERETLVKESVEKKGYRISAGHAMLTGDTDLQEAIRVSDKMMYEDKAKYYCESGQDRRKR